MTEITGKEGARMDAICHIAVPIYELDRDGQVVANPLFHRALDKLHSRCVEYPFAASRVAGAERLLDVGTVKADEAWIKWLEGLPIEVYATDYDEPLGKFGRIRFHRADVQKLPFPDGMFDKVLAVSVIEHIGLESPQTLSAELPQVSEDGDVQAVRELARVLRPGGELVMTVPFGLTDGLVLDNQARSYTTVSIGKFEKILKPVCLEYYEYQSLNPVVSRKQSQPPGYKQQIKDKILSTIKACTRRYHEDIYALQAKTAAQLDIPGMVTWRRIPMSSSSATNRRHIDGVICGVWKKPE